MKDIGWGCGDVSVCEIVMFVCNLSVHMLLLYIKRICIKNLSFFTDRNIDCTDQNG